MKFWDSEPAFRTEQAARCCADRVNEYFGKQHGVSAWSSPTGDGTGTYFVRYTFPYDKPELLDVVMGYIVAYGCGWEDRGLPPNRNC